MKWLLTAFALLFALPAHAQGTLTFAGNVQQNASGQPLAGALLYTYVVNTVATAQLTYQDVNLTLPNPWPLAADQNGRLPFFFVASGSLHARLTDASGNVQFDYPNVLVIGGAGGGGGGGGQVVDPTSVASTGDVKFRMTSESLTGWVILNGQTIGSASSGATGFANAGAQNLFIYLWSNCPNTHCPVSPGGRGSTALADFNANKQLQLIDMRDSMPAGRDCMGNSCLAGILLSNITSGGGDTADTPGASGGAANKTLTLTNLPNILLPTTVSGNVTVTGSTNAGNPYAASVTGGTLGGTGQATFNTQTVTTVPIGPASITVTVPSVGVTSTGGNTMTGTAVLGGSSTAVPVMNPFKLGTWYQKL